MTKKLYLPKGVIVYDTQDNKLIEAWGFRIEEELKDRGIKYNPRNYYYVDKGSCNVYTNEMLYCKEVKPKKEK